MEQNCRSVECESGDFGFCAMCQKWKFDTLQIHKKLNLLILTWVAGGPVSFWQNFQAVNSNLNLTVAAIDAIWAKWHLEGLWSWASAISTGGHTGNSLWDANRRIWDELQELSDTFRFICWKMTKSHLQVSILMTVTQAKLSLKEEGRICNLFKMNLLYNL